MLSFQPDKVLLMCGVDLIGCVFTRENGTQQAFHVSGNGLTPIDSP
ncbi:hypothetical protein [Rubinisphaera sp. JC750]|nr:hypothetical protein [Rubinisphaera sp. JC750]